MARPFLGSGLAGTPAEPVVKGWLEMPQATLLERGLWGAASCSPLMIEMELNGPSTLLKDLECPFRSRVQSWANPCGE